MEQQDEHQAIIDKAKAEGKLNDFIDHSIMASEWGVDIAIIFQLVASTGHLLFAASKLKRWLFIYCLRRQINLQLMTDASSLILFVDVISDARGVEDSVNIR